MVIDGVDFEIQEPRKHGFNKRWFSHKHRGPGVRYELATCVNTGDIVWYNGPFPCGKFNDLRIYRLGLKPLLMRRERVWGDKGYRGEYSVVTPYTARNRLHKKEMGRARARHETYNSRFRRYNALSSVYRHPLEKHYMIYGSVAVICQLENICGMGPFKCFSSHDPAVHI